MTPPPSHQLNDFRGSQLSANDKSMITICVFEELFLCQAFWWGCRVIQQLSQMLWYTELKSSSQTFQSCGEIVFNWYTLILRKKWTAICGSDSSTVQICYNLPTSFCALWRSLRVASVWTPSNNTHMHWMLACSRGRRAYRITVNFFGLILVTNFFMVISNFHLCIFKWQI